MSNRIVAIHQPNLFPWLGYFNKIIRADVFVFLDHVVLNPRTSTNIKKVKIISNKQEFALTIPLKNRTDETFQKIQDMEIEKPALIADKQMKTIEYAYKKTPYFQEVFPLIHDFYSATSLRIAERNIQFIMSAAERMGVPKEFVKSSDLNCQNASTDLLIEIIEKLSGTVYLSGDGASGYQENERYREKGIELTFTKFVHPVYSQLNSTEFIKGLSIVDALMNVGFEEVGNMLSTPSFNDTPSDR